MKNILHKSTTRGHAHHGWLDTWHSFSFAGYHDTSRIHFGALRVLNDDTIAPGMGFGLHPHENMEIITIPLEGELEHEDDKGHHQVVRKGDIQVMSAGTGIMHAEKNASNEKFVRLLQIWVFPDKKNVVPRYEQKYFSDEEKLNRLATVIAPVGSGKGALEIHQNAWFSLGKIDKGRTVSYQLHAVGNGVYAFLVEGRATVNEIAIESRDGLGLSEVETLTITADDDAEVLLMEVPMN